MDDENLGNIVDLFVRALRVGVGRRGAGDLVFLPLSLSPLGVQGAWFQQAVVAPVGTETAVMPSGTALARAYLGDVSQLLQQWGLGHTGVIKFLRAMHVVPAKARKCKVETVLLQRFVASKAQRKVVLRVLFTELRVTLRQHWDNGQWAKASGLKVLPRVRHLDSFRLQKLLLAAHARHPVAFVDTMARVAAQLMSRHP
jgi:hypothetical protein